LGAVPGKLDEVVDVGSRLSWVSGHELGLGVAGHRVQRAQEAHPDVGLFRRGCGCRVSCSVRGRVARCRNVDLLEHVLDSVGKRMALDGIGPKVLFPRIGQLIREEVFPHGLGDV
jgi:hypothetical protein